MKPILLLAAALLFVLGSILALPEAESVDEAPYDSPRYAAAFWDHWGDGQAELAGYDLVYSRYGERREGTAVTIFVTEPFTEATRVKADRSTPDQFQVMKLNLVRDFPTGVYDYNLMTSTFLALSSVGGRQSGTPTKVSFTGQEWCGHVYRHLLFDPHSVRHVLHSYFQGEADERSTLEADPSTTSEDALFLWARGLAYPDVAPGSSAQILLLTSLERSRMQHTEPRRASATLSRDGTTDTLEVPAGEFTVRRASATLDLGKGGSREWRFWVEEDAPHRLVAWQSSAGERAELVGADRMKYWQLHDEGNEGVLSRLGLEPRPPRTP